MTNRAQDWVLVDFENVQKLKLDQVSRLPVHVILFVGSQQKSLPIDVFQKGLAMKERFTVIESSGSGKNALDFQIAFHAGRIVEREPQAILHFVTKDTGFDILVKHMRTSNRVSHRVDSLDMLKLLSSPKNDFVAKTVNERIAHVLERLRKQSPNSLPRRKQTLLSSVSAMFLKQLDARSVTDVVDALIAQGKVIVGANEGVTYCLN